MVRKRQMPPLRPVVPLGLPSRHSVLAPVVADVFRELDLSAALQRGRLWYPIHVVPTNIASFEIALGCEKRRDAYNTRSFRQAWRRRTGVLGRHAGFCDLFVPVGDGGEPWGTLATGPFAVSRPTTGEVRARWRWLSGTHGRLSDPLFARYVAVTLATPTFDAERLDAFRRLVACFARLLSGVGSAAKLAVEAALWRGKLDDARFVERMWRDVASMVDAGTFAGWSSSHRAEELGRLGLSGVPEHVAVGFLRAASGTADPVDELLRRDAFARDGVALARRRGGVACGRVGDHGIVLVLDDAGARTRRRARILEAGERFASLAKRHGFALHLGVSTSDEAIPLPTRYRMALSAAERAFSQGLTVADAERAAPHEKSPLGELRRQLAQATRENPSTLGAQFDRYVEAVATHCGYRLEPTRAHLEAGFDEIVDVLVTAGVVAERDLIEQRDALDREATDAATVKDLSSAYRRVVADIELATSRPNEARHDRSIRRAIAFIRDHLGDSLTLLKVSKVAGFAPGYFSKVFARSERMTFHKYVVRLRLERARQMLLSTPLTVERIGQLCGFRTRNHFHRAYKRAFSTTPHEYRVQGQTVA
jgi:AraC-like DNA-binding protein